MNEFTDDNCPDIITAVINNDTEKVLELLRLGISPNYSEDNDRLSLLHIAVTFNAIDVAEILLTWGGNLHARSSYDGQTPIELAEAIISPCLGLLRKYNKLYAENTVTYLDISCILN